MKFSPLADRLAGSGADAWTVHMEATRLQATGRKVTFLTIGDPDQSAPASVVDAACDALRAGRKGYSAYAGLPQVRAAVAARIQRRSGATCAASNVIVMPGAQAGVYAAVQCIAGPGDEVIVPEPVYATYPGGGRRQRRAHRHPAARSGPRLPSGSGQPWRGRSRPRTRAIWINTPHNPTGAVLTPREMAGHRAAVPTPRPLAAVRRGLRGHGLRPAARQRLVPAGHGRSRDRGLQPFQVARHPRLSLRLDRRAARR